MKLLPLALIFSTVCIGQRIDLKPGEFSKVALGEIKPAHKTWIRNTSTQAHSKNLDEPAIRQLVINYTSKNKLADQSSIDGLTVLILEETITKAEKDISGMTESIKSNKKKMQQLRDIRNEIDNSGGDLSRQKYDSMKTIVINIDRSFKANTANDRVTPTGSNNVSNVSLVVKKVTEAEMNYLKDTIKNKLDSLSEMGEMESLRLQMAMDRMSKMMSTLSNLLKKISDTASQIVQNLK